MPVGVQCHADTGARHFAELPRIDEAHDRIIYTWRHLVQNYFAKIKEFRGIATRYDKMDIRFAANLYLVATIPLLASLLILMVDLGHHLLLSMRLIYFLGQWVKN